MGQRSGGKLPYQSIILLTRHIYQLETICTFRDTHKQWIKMNRKLKIFTVLTRWHCTRKCYQINSPWSPPVSKNGGEVKWWRPSATLENLSSARGCRISNGWEANIFLTISVSTLKHVSYWASWWIQPNIFPRLTLLPLRAPDFSESDQTSSLRRGALNFFSCSSGQRKKL